MTNEEKIIQYMTYPAFPATFGELRQHVITDETALSDAITNLLSSKKIKNVGSKKKSIYILNEENQQSIL